MDSNPSQTREDNNNLLIEHFQNLQRFLCESYTTAGTFLLPLHLWAIFIIHAKLEAFKGTL